MKYDGEVVTYLLDQIKEKNKEIDNLKKRIDKKSKVISWKRQAIKVYENICLATSIIFLMTEIMGIFISRFFYIYDSWFDKNFFVMFGLSILFFIVPNIVNLITNLTINNNEKGDKKNDSRRNKTVR